MARNWNSLFKRLVAKVMGTDTHTFSQTSYAQNGEDLIVHGLFNQLGIPKPSYLDIGAHHPIELSNTYFFYRQGCTGVLIEPNPVNATAFHKYRPKDVFLNAGLSPDASTNADFFVMSASTLNTFSAQEAEGYAKEGYTIVKKLSLPLLALSDVLRDYIPKPDFISLDTEGMDIPLLRSYDFSQHRPAVFCIETAAFSSTRQMQVKEMELFEIMDKANYMVYADTWINTIFVDKSRFFS